MNTVPHPEETQTKASTLQEDRRISRFTVYMSHANHTLEQQYDFLSYVQVTSGSTRYVNPF